MAHATSIGDSTLREESRVGPVGRRLAWRLAAALTLVALAPWPAQAQFGMLKKLKNAVGAPDSSARVKDSLAQIAAGVKPDSVKVGKGLLARGMAAAGEVSDKMEKTTGVSAKDAALAATGVSASNLIAKKMGVDPTSLGKQAVANAKLKSQQKAMQAATGATGLDNVAGLGATARGMAGMSGIPAAAQLQQMQSAIAQAGHARAQAGAAIPGGGLAGFTQADAEALVAFQQEMMQVAMAASAGDASAKARLDAWQALSLKHQAEIQQLTIAAQAGDLSAVQKLQLMQFTIMKEWAQTASAKDRVKRALHQ